MQYYRQTFIQKHLQVRARIIQSIRKFFNDNDYLEIETPIRIPAPAPEAHIDAIESVNWFLQTSPELCMKRLLAADFRRIFQICKCFRKGERGKKHLPEMTMLEWYRAESDYQGMMEECESLIRFVAAELNLDAAISYQGQKIELHTPWPRISVAEAFEIYASIPLEVTLNQDRFSQVMVEEIEPNLQGPTPVFLYDYPACCGALAKLKTKNNEYAERFELYIGGLEICNAFSELTDPAEQIARFELERRHRKESGKPVYPMPEKFLSTLKDMPQASGNALGIDRLVMLFTNSNKIDDIVTFTPEEL
jgi:lysyl-tRNA synthetase class 2